MDTLIWQDAVEQARAIRDGETTSLALTTTYLERIDQWNPTLRAYVSVDTDGALAAAQAADELLAAKGPDAAPPFLGVTLSIKDVIGIKGLPTTHSAKPLADNVADDDPLVRLLLRLATELEVAQPWADRVPPASAETVRRRFSRRRRRSGAGGIRGCAPR